MTSEERHANRYQRRKEKREQKRISFSAEFDNYERVISYASLLSGCNQSRKGVSWKASVQRYEMNALKYTARTHRQLANGENVAQGFIEFDICERGKARHIKSVHFKERCVQRSLCDNALIPVLSRSLIYDNGASLKNKGIHFSLGRVKTHLHRYFRKYGAEGYVLLIDLSKYFDNIQHGPIYDLLARRFSDERIIRLCKDFIEPFGDKSVGIGSQISQIIAISYPSGIDHYIKQDLGIRFFGRYNDDSYLIHPDKNYLQKCAALIAEKYAARGISLNVKKTRIVKLSGGFTFLKQRFFLTETGKVITKPCRASIVRMRRKLKKMKRIFAAGRISIPDIRCSYRSWRGYISHTCSHQTVKRMDELFINLFSTKP